MRLADFADVFRRMPGLLLLGMGLQYTVMPGLGWLFSRWVGTPGGGREGRLGRWAEGAAGRRGFCVEVVCGEGLVQTQRKHDPEPLPRVQGLVCVGGGGRGLWFV